MADRTVRHEYPEDDQFVAMAKETGSIEGLARRLGIASSTLRHHLNNQSDGGDLKVKVYAATASAREEKSTKLRGARAVPADEPVSREEMLETRNSELESALRTHRKGQVLDELALTRYTKAFGQVQPRYSPLVVKKRGKKVDPHEHVLLFSDAHANEVVSFEETMGLNAYDWQVMLKRMARIQQSVLSFIENRPYPISKLHVWLLGDNISGDIHQELSETNEMPHEESVVQWSLDFAEWVQEFVPYYPKIALAGVPGNHPRRSQKPTAKMAFNNSDWTAYKFLEARLEGQDAFSFNFAKSKFMEATVAERWKGLLLHGDGVRSTMVDVPWGGIIRYLGKLARQYVAAGKPIDLFALGHYHQANAIEAGGPGVKTFVNGTLKGVDEYSLQRFGGGGPPTQILLTVHPRHGVTDVSYLDCEETTPQHERLAAAA